MFHLSQIQNILHLKCDFSKIKILLQESKYSSELFPFELSLKSYTRQQKHTITEYSFMQNYRFDVNITTKNNVTLKFFSTAFIFLANTTTIRCSTFFKSLFFGSHFYCSQPLALGRQIFFYDNLGAFKELSCDVVYYSSSDLHQVYF